MKQRGVKIKELGIGKPIRKLKLTFRPKFLRFAVILGPIPNGAYVEPTKKGYRKLEKLSYEDAAICYAAGIISHIAFAGVLALITLPFVRSYTEAVILIAVFCIALVTVAFRKFVSMVVVPVVGALGFIAFIASGVWILIASISLRHTDIKPIDFSIHVPTLLEVLYFGIVASLLFAVANMFPNPPVDGNKVLLALLKKWELKWLIEYLSLILWFAFKAMSALLIASMLIILLFK
jgi:Zn-dependent protease